MSEEIGWAMSKKAIKKYLKGEWEVTNGGFRNVVTGKIEELVKPVVKEASSLAKEKVVGSLTSPITLVSSLANNIQSAHIEYGVQQANKKLDISLEKLDNLQKSVNGLSKLGVLGWVNCAVGIANCGISIVGFKETFERMDKISSQLQSMTQIMNKKIEKDYKRDYRKYYMVVKDYIPFLEKGNVQEQVITTISPYTGEIVGFLDDVIDSFLDDFIDPGLACEIIFSLSTIWSKFIKTYSALYYYNTKSILPSYEDWKRVLNRIVTPQFVEKIREYLLIQNIDTPLQKKHIVYNTLEYIPNYELGELVHNEQCMQILSKKMYLNCGEYVKRYLNTDAYDMIGTNVYIPIKDATHNCISK